MLDKLGRHINYLRVSVTDRCNLRCIYCVPESGIHLKEHDDILRYEELERIIKIATHLGITKLRVTGGEPLVRKGLVGFIDKVNRWGRMEDISLTTNGVLLEYYASDLFKAGVKRINISLDTLRPERFKTITRLGNLSQVLKGISIALARGFSPVKINTVIMRGINDDEIESLAGLSREEPLHIRFIELMPLGESYTWSKERFVPAAEIREKLLARGNLEPAEVPGNGPAIYYRLPGAKGTVGFISAMTEHFCGACNRLRLTADGKLKPCLASPIEVDLKRPLRSGSSDRELEEIIRNAVLLKPPEHHMDLAATEYEWERKMLQIGG